MSCQNILGAKAPGAQVVLTFDFSPALDTGETLSAIASRAVETIAGVDANAAAMWNGAAAISLFGLTAQQPVQGGVDGCYYQFTMTCNTTAGRVLVVTAVLPVSVTS